MERYTVKDFNLEFSDDDACLEWLRNHLYPDGIVCPKCGSVTKHHRISKRRCYSCDNCGTHTYPTAGTIFHKSSTSLRLWFYAIYLMSSTRCGIAAKQLERELGVTYKTAWRMFHQIRKLLQEDVGLLSGEVEVDETYVGGKKPGKRGRGAGGKTIVAGMVERQGKVNAQKVSSVKASTLIPLVQANIIPGTTVYTDELPSYNKLEKAGYTHYRVHHASGIYAIGRAHTNNIENFWGQLKRSIDGTHHAVSGKYLQRYIDEFSFRYNHRQDIDHLFFTWLSRVCQGLEQIGHPLYGGLPSLDQK
jgi:hypothetical protein